MLAIKEKQCLQWAEVRKFYFLLSWLLPINALACTSIQAHALSMVVYCLLSFIIHNFILY